MRHKPTHAKWPLPAVPDPADSICFQIKVPNDRRHITAFLGAIYELSKPYAWEDDPAHTALVVGAVWLKIFDNLMRGCPCPTPAPLGQLEDLEMPIRIDCDCNVFVTCCDGTEKQILTSEQVKKLIEGPSVPGAPQPGPGQCQGFDLSNFGNTPALIPVPLSTGDTITLSNVLGASSVDGIAWLCAADGKVFFAGDCVGSPGTSAGDRVPAAPQGQVIVGIDGSFYAFSGLNFIVPAGITNKQASIWLNWPAGDTIYGQINAHANVCNNALGTWTSIFDFALNPYTGILSIIDGQWSAGYGFIKNPASPNPDAIQLDTGVLTAIHLTSANFVYDAATTGSGSPGVGIETATTNYGGFDPVVDGTGEIFSHVEDRAGVTELFPTINNGAGGGACAMRSFTVHGIGTKPPSWP